MLHTSLSIELNTAISIRFNLCFFPRVPSDLSRVILITECSLGGTCASAYLFIYFIGCYLVMNVKPLQYVLVKTHVTFAKFRDNGLSQRSQVFFTSYM